MFVNHILELGVAVDPQFGMDCILEKGQRMKLYRQPEGQHLKQKGLCMLNTHTHTALLNFYVSCER